MYKGLGIPGVILLMVIIILLSLFLIHRLGEPEGTPAASDQVVKVIDEDRGIYYFHATSDFGSQLSAFLGEHPELRPLMIAPLDNVGHGATRGYWVVFERTTKKKD